MKISTETIQGFAEMSAEDQVKALLAYEMPEPDMSGYIQKTQFDRVSSELAEAKRSLKARMTDDEQAQEHVRELEAQVAAMTRSSRVSELKAQYVALGYSSDLAEKTAEALLDGDTARVLEHQTAFITSREAAIRADAIKQTIIPTGKDPEDSKKPYVPPKII